MYYYEVTKRSNHHDNDLYRATSDRQILDRILRWMQGNA